ncbi:hypothetical protein [Candidatus Protochlamydia phocaeensis]|uniref:hypothetical protein n=1 Tax=Candidatus Protochlamydia phocaeensis TaxID=1414722 RepID=UPI000838E81F|nr:hypothetical protein [Candidatus Protochlamydia phocaeensis]
MDSLRPSSFPSPFKWQGLTDIKDKLGKVAGAIGAKLGIVKLKPEAKAHIEHLVNETMKSVLNEETLRRQRVIGNPYSAPNDGKKFIKSVRTMLKDALTDATIKSMKGIAKEKGISRPGEIAFSQAAKTDKFNEVLQSKLGDTFFQENISGLLKEGATPEERRDYRFLSNLYQELKSSYPQVQNALHQLAELETKHPEESTRMEAVKQEIQALKGQISDFNDKATRLNMRYASVDPEVKASLRKADKDIQKNIEEFVVIAQEQRAQGLLNLAHRIFNADELFKQEKASKGRVDKQSTAWKEFEKDVAAFVQGVGKLQAKLFNNNYGSVKLQIFDICDKWEIEYNK